MINKCPIPGHEEDNMVFSIRRHFMSLFKTFFLVILMLIIPILVVSAFRRIDSAMFSNVSFNFLVVIGSIYYLITVTFAFLQWVTYYYNLFMVTDKEVLDVTQDGLFDRRVTEISLLRIQDVSARIHGFLGTIFNYGDVVAESAGENSRTYIIKDIPNPIAVANRILDLHNEHIAKEERADEIIIGEGDLRGGLKKVINNNNCPPCPPCETSPQNFTNQAESPFALSAPFQENNSSQSIVEPPQTQSTPEPPSSSYPPASAFSSASIPTNITNEGNISKDDLDKGGEVKL